MTAQIPAGAEMTDADLAAWARHCAMAKSEGFCPYGHGPLERVRLHGKDFSACLACECAWRFSDGKWWGVACIPGSHTCGEGRP